MTITNPETLPLSRSDGTASDPCLQQKAALVHAHIHGYLDSAGLDRVLTDRPCWQNKVVNVFGMAVNDRLPKEGGWFKRLDKLTPRMVAATVAADPAAEHRINARLLCWLAREVLPIFEDRFPDDGRPRKAIETREAWLRGEATEQDCARAALAALAAGAAEAAGAANAARAAGAAWAERLLRMLEELCDQHDKARAEEGAALDDGWLIALRDAGLITDQPLHEGQQQS